ncbi:MAG: flagellar hook-associated protein FlgK [Armatimonadota bacterium]
MSTFNILNIGLSGLIANQKSLEVTGHNVANVNTPGYHRQEAIQQARDPYPMPGSQMSPSGGLIGTGVDVVTIRRMQNTFLQQQLRNVQSQLGQWNMAQDSLQQIESFLSPGQNLDLSSQFDSFFSGWQTLATHPEELASRMTVRSTGVNLATTLNDMTSKLDFMSTQVETTLQGKVDRLNQLADILASQNAHIGMATGENRAPNDILDQRDQVLGEMNTIAGVSSLSDDAAASVTNLGGRALVQGDVVHHLKLEMGPTGMRVVWADDGAPIDVQKGEIAGLLQTRDTIIPAYKNQLNDIATSLISAVNNLHSSGVTMQDLPAGNFFTGDSAGTIKVDDAILADAQHVAATRLTDSIGDGSLAKDIYTLNTTALIGNQTLNQYAQSLIGRIGNDVLTAQTSVSAGNALQDQLTNQQEAVSGVSLDEELTNMMIYQRAYDASARVMTTADQMMQTIIEKMG